MNQLGNTEFRGDDKFGLGFQIVSEKRGTYPRRLGPIAGVALIQLLTG